MGYQEAEDQKHCCGHQNHEIASATVFLRDRAERQLQFGDGDGGGSALPAWGNSILQPVSFATLLVGPSPAAIPLFDATLDDCPSGVDPIASAQFLSGETVGMIVNPLEGSDGSERGGIASLFTADDAEADGAGGVCANAALVTPMTNAKAIDLMAKTPFDLWIGKLAERLPGPRLSGLVRTSMRQEVSGLRWAETERTSRRELLRGE